VGARVDAEAAAGEEVPVDGQVVLASTVGSVVRVPEDVGGLRRLVDERVVDDAHGGVVEVDVLQVVERDRQVNRGVAVGDRPVAAPAQRVDGSVLVDVIDVDRATVGVPDPVFHRGRRVCGQLDV
jgi:hypothetical protein